MSINFSEDAQQEVVTSSRVLPEDSGEGSLRPRLLRDYTGQEKAKENLQVCIDAARLRGEPLDTCCSTALRGWQDDDGCRHRKRDGRKYAHHLRPCD